MPECDLVMAGGVTSAVAYAGVLGKLAQTYRFRCLGGTSAGAAAAAAGAIAERGRLETGLPLGFLGLLQLPQEMARTDCCGRTDLLKLFQPHPDAKAGYRVVLAALGQTGKSQWLRAMLAAARAAVCEFKVAALLGALLGAALMTEAIAQAWSIRSYCAAGMTLLLGLAVTALLGVLFALGWGGWRTARAVVRNHFGFCSGMPAKGSDGEALTPMLHRIYNKLLKREPGERPVVFGELWGAAALQGGPREIDLQVITTVLNLKQPLRLPGDPGQDPLHGYFFDPREWKELFPASVMDWLAAKRRDGGALRIRFCLDDSRELAPFPPPSAWPVVMAARMSLSFPGLLSAVPVYRLEPRREARRNPQCRYPHKTKAAADRDEDVRLPDGAVYRATKIYFSDGGITSNCPIHLFDAPLPQRPTFGVNLWRIDHAPCCESASGRNFKVWMGGEEPDPALRARPFHERFLLTALPGFVGAIFGTMLDWRDSMQRMLPGYRERVVHIGLGPGEGGLNLAMPGSCIIDLGLAGEAGAIALVRTFEGSRLAQFDGWQFKPTFNAWDQHRWIRMRTTLAAAEEYLNAVDQRLAAGQPPFRDWPQRALQPDPRFVDADAAAQAQTLMDGAEDLIAAVRAASPDSNLNENVPEPAPALRMSPPW